MIRTRHLNLIPCTLADLEAILADKPALAARLQVAIPEDSPLLREWIVVVDAPSFAAALVAWERVGQDDVPDRERKFEALWTVDGRIVRDAARTTPEEIATYMLAMERAA